MANKPVVTGASKLRRRFALLRQRLPQALPQERIESFLIRRIKERYSRGIDANLSPFRALAPSTVRRKARMAGLARTPSSILFETGEMYNSIGVVAETKGLSSPSGAGFSIGIKSRDLKVQRRARAHQFGLGRVPQRRFLGVSRLDVKAIDSLLRRELARQIRTVGL